MEKLLHEFDQRWRHQTPPRLDDYVARIPGEAAAESARGELLAELIMIDLQYRWRLAGQGKIAPLGAIHERPCLEKYLERYAELGRPGSLPVELIAEEYWVRHVWGDRPAHAEYLRRFAASRADLPAALARMDAELTDELAGPRAQGNGIRQESAAVPSTATGLVATLRQNGLLATTQLDELDQDLRRRSPAPRVLARELMQRGWLTAYQVNQLLLGRGADLVLGPYLLLERLGEGGAGQVFKARHQKLNREAAIKLLRKELLADAEAVARFYREIQTVSQMKHPNVVHAYDAGPTEAGHFLAMEYVEGTDLGKLVKQGGPLPVGQACEYVRQAALGLQHAHERGLVHRDIKPHNLLLASGARESPGEKIVKLTDLGLARLRRPIDEECSAVLGGARPTGTLTPENAVLGTPDYTSPEQALDFHRADIRSDIYSLGCTFYYLLTGQAPFAGGTFAQKLLKHQQSDPPDVAEFRKDVPGELALVLRKMMAKKQEERFQTPAEVAARLTSIAGAGSTGEGRSNRPSDAAAPSAAVQPRRRRRWLIGVAMSVVLSLAVYGLIRLLALQPPSPNSSPSVGMAGGPSERRKNLPEGVSEVLGEAGEHREAGALAVSPDGTWVAWAEKAWPKKGGISYSIRLWNTTKQAEADRLPVREPAGMAATVNQLAFSPDSKMLAVATTGRVDLWNVAFAKSQCQSLEHHKPQRNDEIHALAYAEDGKILVTGGFRIIKFWDLPTRKEREEAQLEQKSAVRSLAISPDGKTLVAAYAGPTVRLWGIDKKELDPLENANAPIKFLPNDNNGLVTNGKNNAVWLWNLAKRTYTTFPLPTDLSQGPGELAQLAISPNGKQLAAARNSSLVVWDIGGQKKVYSKSISSRIKAIAFLPDGRLLTANADGTVFIFRLPD
jgi:serine/threonine-protein kinase